MDQTINFEKVLQRLQQTIHYRQRNKKASSNYRGCHLKLGSSPGSIHIRYPSQCGQLR
jgi:hypothetical protein